MKITLKTLPAFLSGVPIAVSAVSLISAVSVLGIPAFAQGTNPPAVSVAAPTIPSPFPAAKSVVGKGLFSVANAKGEFEPFFDVILTVNGANHYRIDAIPLLPSMKAKGPSFYFSDAAKQYEYNSLRGRYTIKDAPLPGERPGSQLASMAGLELVLVPDKPASPNVKRVITEETLEGRRMIVTTDNEAPRPSQNGGTFIAFRKTWVDAQTGFPAKTLEGVESDGKIVPNLQFLYTDWKIDTPVPPQTFVWAAPAGAEEEHPDVLPVGTLAPDFAAITPAGKTVRLSDYKGKVVILDFWATWCGPCQKSLPHLQKVYQQVKAQGVVVLAVCVWDDRPKYDQWVKTNQKKFTFTTVFDKAGRGPKDIAKSLYGVTGIPTQYLIGKDGKIVAGFTGFEEGNPQLENALRKASITLPTTVAAHPQ